jgi:hypothetical protein
MNIKTLGTAVVVTVVLTVPAFAAHHHMHGPSYHGLAHGYGPTYGTRTFRGAYARVPVDEPFYDLSRIGGMDPDMHPSAY